MVKAIVVEITDVEKGDIWDRVLTSTGTLRCAAGKWEAGDLAVWVEDDEFVFLSERKHDWPLGEDVTDLLDQEHEEAVSSAPATLRLQPPVSELEQLRDEVDRLVVFCWKNNLCPFGLVRPGEHVSACTAGFPGCLCMDAVVKALPDEPPPEAA